MDYMYKLSKSWYWLKPIFKFIIFIMIIIFLMMMKRKISGKPISLLYRTLEGTPERHTLVIFSLFSTDTQTQTQTQTQTHMLVLRERKCLGQFRSFGDHFNFVSSLRSALIDVWWELKEASSVRKIIQDEDRGSGWSTLAKAGKHTTISLSDWITNNFTFFKSFHVDSYGQMLDGDISPSLMALCVFFFCIFVFIFHDYVCGTGRHLIISATEGPPVH